MAAAGRGGGTGRSVHEPEQQHRCRAGARMAAAGWSGSGWRSTKILGNFRKMDNLSISLFIFKANKVFT